MLKKTLIAAALISGLVGTAIAAPSYPALTTKNTTKFDSTVLLPTAIPGVNVCAGNLGTYTPAGKVATQTAVTVDHLCNIVEGAKENACTAKIYVGKTAGQHNCKGDVVATATLHTDGAVIFSNVDKSKYLVSQDPATKALVIKAVS